MEFVILYLLFALSISFMCSVLEAVLLSTPVSYITMKENEGVADASLLMHYKQNIDKPISAILSINTIAHTIGAAGVGAEAVKIFGEAYFGIISAILTILILVLSEIIPKTIGASYWRNLAIGSAKWIRVLVIISYPLVVLSEFITRVISSKNQDNTMSKEELSAMVDVSTADGILKGKESLIIKNIFRLEQIHARDVMTPRIVVTCASEDITVNEFYQNKSYLHYSRIPLYGESRENITGYLLRDEMLEKLAEDSFVTPLKELKRQILFFPDSASLITIWEKMLEKKEHIVLIVDEYGSFEGIITMEDVIESILGLEILDEKDEIVDMQQYAKERWKQRKEKYKHLTNENN